jgi:hypothetical protein
MATSEASAIRATRSLDFQGSPLPMARVIDLPPSKSLSPSAMYKSERGEIEHFLGMFTINIEGISPKNYAEKYK